MPTYTVHATPTLLSQQQRSHLAREITRVHNEATGAQTFFAQVLFVDHPEGRWFVGGRPLQGDQLFVHGQIRSGRLPAAKSALLERLLDVAAAVARVPRNRVWAYIVEVPPSQMAEYGHVLPEPGTEANWLAAIPPEDRALMESTARDRESGSGSKPQE